MFHNIINQVREKIGFFSTSISLATVYAASSAPIPLYSSYQERIQLSAGDLSMTAVAYFAGTVLALLAFARLSDYAGRKPVSLIALLLALLGCVAFLNLSSITLLFGGRFLQGISCGLASSAIAAWAVDSAPANPAWLAAGVTSGSPMLGLAAGSFGSGIFKQYLESSAAIFVVIIVLLSICIILSGISKETVSRKKGVIASLVPGIKVPQSVRKQLPAAICIFAGTWAIGGLYQAFSSSMANTLFGTPQPVLAAAIFAFMMAPNLLGGSLAGRFKPGRVQQLGMLCFSLSFVIVAFSLQEGMPVLFLVSTFIAGGLWGGAFSASMGKLLKGTEANERAGLLSAIFLISYAGAAIPNFIVARVAAEFSLIQIVTAYTFLVAVMALLTILFVWLEARGDSLQPPPNRD